MDQCSLSIVKEDNCWFLDKFWHFFGVFLPFWHFSTIFDNMDQCLLSIVKDDNPWDVSSLYDFNYYCCPECDSKSQNKQDFINHASNNHPWVSKCCFLGTNTGYLMAKCIFLISNYLESAIRIFFINSNLLKGQPFAPNLFFIFIE